MTDMDDATDGRTSFEPEVTETARLLGSQAGREDGVDRDRLPWWRRPSVFWLAGPYLVFALAFGGMIVPKLNLIIELVCRHYYIEQQKLDPGMQSTPVLLFQGDMSPQCKGPAVQKRVATFILSLNLVTGILSAIVTPKLGQMSDRYGRTRLMAIASCGGLMSEVVTILAARFPDVVSHHWLILGSLFDGLGGSLAAGSTLSQSYASDCSTPSTRAVSFGYITACMFAGLALGPLTAGYFVKWTGSLISIFYVTFCCHAFYITATAFVIPESLSKQRQKVARDKWDREQAKRGPDTSKSWVSTARAWNPLLPLKVLWVTGPGTSARLRINLVALAVSNAIVMGINLAAGAIVMLYAEAVFHWGNFETSKFVSTISFARVFALMVLSPLLNRLGRALTATPTSRSGGPMTVAAEKNAGADRVDIWILRAALTSDILGCLGYIASGTQAAFVVSGIVTSLGGLGVATLQSVVTKHVPAERVGQVLGAIGTIEALGRVAGPLMFNGLYALTVGTFPKAIFVLLCSLFGVVFICSFILKPGIYWKEDPEDEANETTRDEVEINAALALAEEPSLL